MSTKEAFAAEIQAGPPFSEDVMHVAGTHMSRGLLMDQLGDDMVPLTMVATPDQMKAVNAGVRLVFDCLDNYGYQIIDEEGSSLNPPHEVVDFSLTKLWDDYAARINS